MGKALERRVQRGTRRERNAAHVEIPPSPTVYALVNRWYNRRKRRGGRGETLRIDSGENILYALENEVYGILFWCAMMAGVIFAWQYAFCSRNTWIIGKRKLLERHVRHREKIEGLKEYLF